MGDRSSVTAGDLEAALECVVSCLRPGVDRDWSAPAGELEWACRLTAEHTGHCLIAYAAQLAVQQPARYVRLVVRAEREASPADVLEVIEAGGRILASAVRTSPPDVRAYHPYGVSDPEGFAGMGCVEVLVHGFDIATGLGLTIDPPREVCERVVARMFPDASEKLAGIDVDPWTALRWATGRVELPGRPRVEQWRWHGAPLA